MSECTWTKEEHESTAVECTAHGMIDAAKATRMLAEIERLQAKIRELESENNGQVPGTLTREEADAALVARGFMGLYHASNKEIRERASKAINPISGPILRAYVRGLDAQGVEAPTDAANRAAIMEAAVVLGEEPPTQPPHRERCKPIAGPWTDGIMTYDERGWMLASASKTTEGFVVCVNRPHMVAEIFRTTTEYEAMTAIRERLATWCDVTALTIPEAP